MADPEPNPLLGHVMNIVEGRQQSELAKISILGQMASTLAEIRDKLTSIEALLLEQQKRAKG